MEDKSLFSSSQPQGGISEDFRQFIKETIEEVLIEGKTFDVQKRWLRRLGATEGVDCDTLERNMTDLIEVMEEWKQLKAKSGERMAKMIGKECYLTEQEIEGLLQKLAGGNQTATSVANPTKDASMMSGSQSHAAEDEYISECIKEVCINGDSLSKYQRLIEKKHGAEFYQQCEGFVEEVQRSVGKKKFTNTSVANLHYLARQIGVSEAIVDAVVEHYTDKFEEEERLRQAAEKKRQEEARRAKEEAERRRAREETERKAKEEKEQTTGELNGHEYVDLGLPSGTLWATCNVGANKPGDYGSYFAWGETQSKISYSWDTYKYANGTSNMLTKYCNKADNFTTLQASDDPATANWGSGWRTPAKAQWEELINNTTHKWTTRNGKQGRLFTAKNGQSLFLPAAGKQWGSGLSGAGKYGSYWSRSLDTDLPCYAIGLELFSTFCSMFGDYRGNGFSVRPVREK